MEGLNKDDELYIPLSEDITISLNSSDEFAITESDLESKSVYLSYEEDIPGEERGNLSGEIEKEINFQNVMGNKRESNNLSPSLRSQYFPNSILNLMNEENTQNKNTYSELNYGYTELDKIMSKYTFFDAAKIILKINNGILEDNGDNHELYQQLKKISSVIKNKNNLTLMCLGILSSKIQFKKDEERENKVAKENNLNIYDTYVDDGYSGTSFDRPEFNRMIQDIENKKINMVITKDLSRLGRDYIMSGYYTEQYFPLHNVRYIALLDNIDTYLDSSNNDIAPFKSILNDMYAKDISKKIKSVLKSKKEMGLFVGKEAPYGYQKDPNNKYQLVIDEQAAMIVREIFERYLNGDGTKIIADDLSKRHVPIPSVHKQTNIGYKSPNYGLWNNTAIKRILQNEEYTGCLVQNKYNKLNYKSKKLVHLPKEKWVKTENKRKYYLNYKTVCLDIHLIWGKIGRASCRERV